MTLVQLLRMRRSLRAWIEILSRSKQLWAQAEAGFIEGPLTSTSSFVSGQLWKSWRKVRNYDSEESDEAYQRSPGLDWLRKIVHQVIFDPERIKTIATKMENSLASYRRDGYSVASAAQSVIGFSNKSNSYWNNMFKQEQILSKLRQTLDSDPDSVVQDLERIRNHLKSRCFFYCSTNFGRVSSTLLDHIKTLELRNVVDTK